MEKTLDQYLQEIGTGDLALPKHRKEVLKAARTWLKNKREQLDPNYSGMMADYREDIAECARADLLDKLIEELQVQEESTSAKPQKRK